MRQAILPLLVALAIPAFADVEIPREEAATIKSYDLDKAESILSELEGKVVKLKFNYRGTTIKKNEDGSGSGSIDFWKWESNRSQLKSGGLPATIPKEGLEWFQRIPTSVGGSRSSIVVFARIEKGTNGSPEAKLLGREIKTDLKGSKIVW